MNAFASDDDETKDVTTSDVDEGEEVYIFNGVQYETYQGMVDAKKQRNLQRMEDLGLLGAARGLKLANKKKKEPGKKRESKPTIVRRNKPRAARSKGEMVRLATGVRGFDDLAGKKGRGMDKKRRAKRRMKLKKKDSDTESDGGR